MLYGRILMLSGNRPVCDKPHQCYCICAQLHYCRQCIAVYPMLSGDAEVSLNNRLFLDKYSQCSNDFQTGLSHHLFFQQLLMPVHLNSELFGNRKSNNNINQVNSGFLIFQYHSLTNRKEYLPGLQNEITVRYPQTCMNKLVQ